MQRTPRGRQAVVPLLVPRPALERWVELCRAGPHQAPAWRGDQRAAVFPSLFLCPLQGQSAAGGLRAGPVPIQVIQQDRKPSTLLPAPSAGQVCRISALCWGLAQREAQPVGKGHVPEGICLPVAGAGCWAAARTRPSAKPEAAPSLGQPPQCPALPFTCTVAQASQGRLMVPPMTRAHHPHMKLRAGVFSWDNAEVCTKGRQAGGRAGGRQAGEDKFISLNHRLLKASGAQACPFSLPRYSHRLILDLDRLHLAEGDPKTEMSLSDPKGSWARSDWTARLRSRSVPPGPLEEMGVHYLGSGGDLCSRWCRRPLTLTHPWFQP